MSRGTKYNYEDYHKEIDGVLYKKCVNHQLYFPEEDDWLLCTNEYFYSNIKNKKDGLNPSCKRCEIIRADIRQRDNYEEQLENQRKYDRKPERLFARRKIQKGLRERGYFERYFEKYPEKMVKYNEDRRHKNHNITKQEWDACKKYFNYQCAYCGLPIENHYRIYAGESQKIDLHKEHVNHEGGDGLNNCIPSCGSCNNQKWKFTLDEWYNENNSNFTQERLEKIFEWLTEDYKQFEEINRKPKRKYNKRKVS